MKRPITTTLMKISRLYELVAEMREIVSELKAVKVDVRMSREACIEDPLGTRAGVQITLMPGCDLL